MVPPPLDPPPCARVSRDERKREYANSSPSFSSSSSSFDGTPASVLPLLLLPRLVNPSSSLFCFRPYSAVLLSRFPFGSEGLVLLLFHPATTDAANSQNSKQRATPTPPPVNMETRSHCIYDFLFCLPPSSTIKKPGKKEEEEDKALRKQGLVWHGGEDGEECPKSAEAKVFIYPPSLPPPPIMAPRSDFSSSDSLPHLNWQ